MLSKQQLDFLAGIQVINMNCVLHDTYRKITFKYVFTEAPFNVTHIFSERRNRSSWPISIFIVCDAQAASEQQIKIYCWNSTNDYINYYDVCS